MTKNTLNKHTRKSNAQKTNNQHKHSKQTSEKKQANKHANNPTTYCHHAVNLAQLHGNDLKTNCLACSKSHKSRNLEYVYLQWKCAFESPLGKGFKTSKVQRCETSAGDLSGAVSFQGDQWRLPDIDILMAPSTCWKAHEDELGHTKVTYGETQISGAYSCNLCLNDSDTNQPWHHLSYLKGDSYIRY